MISGSISREFVGYIDEQAVYREFRSTGTVPYHSMTHSINARKIDDLWDMMYINPRPVIIVCAYCKCHNAVTNPACIQCGAPMGIGVERVFA